MRTLGFYQISPGAINLDGAETALLNQLLTVWYQHLNSNLRNLSYYNMERPFYAIKGAVPEQLRNFRAVCGWAAKAVDMLAGRSVLRGFVSDGDAAELLDQVVEGNGMRELYRQTLTSELVCSCAFLTVSQGLEGEPPVLVSAYSALNAAAIWDERRKRIKAGLAVVDTTTDNAGNTKPSWVNMYTDDYTYMMRRANNGRWVVDKVENPLGRPLMEPLRYRPTLDREFGKSRVSPAVRSIVDEAMYAVQSTAVANCFYTWPQRYLLGVDRKTAEEYSQEKLETYVNSLLMVTPNKNGDIPQYGQLSQMSMEPHTEYLRALAERFAGETSVPISALGITFDNPSSAEALYAQETDLIVEAECLNAGNGDSLRQVALMALAQLRGTDLDGLSEDDLTIQADFENPQRPSMAARADFAIKVASAVPEYAQTDDFWRELGFEEARIKSLRKEMRYPNATNFFANYLTSQTSQAAQPAVSE